MNFKLIALAAALALMPTLHAATPVNPKPFTAPEVAQWEGSKGSFVPSAASTRIVAPDGDARVAEIAQMLSKDIELVCGTTFAVDLGAKARKTDIALKLTKPRKDSKPESYTINITPKGVTLSAPGSEGLFWATRTLVQLLQQAPADLSLPAGEINDAPAYSVRGFMIDAGRKFIPMDYLHALVNSMSHYKMNVLQVHLNDNGFHRFYDNDWSKTQAAFRMESDKFPGLTARDGSYSKQEFREFIAYAKARGVEIIPEIDVPAHSLAFTRYMPELTAKWPNDVDHLDIDNPKTYEFLDALIEEYIGGDDPVFSGPIFHVGTDEYKGDSITMEKFRAFTDRYIRYVESFGKKPAIWGSLTHAKGQTPVKVDNVLMYGWSVGWANPKDMLELGYEMIAIPDGTNYIVPAAGYYHDYLNNRWLYENWTPARMGGYTVPDDKLGQMKGGMYAVWNDTPTNGITVKDIAHRIQHSMAVMAATTWSAGSQTVPFDEFAAKSAPLGEGPGTNYLGRYGAPGSKEEVVKLAVVAPGSTLPIEEIGYDYTVEFDLEGAAEAKGTKLFESKAATVWLSDPVTGCLAFSREELLQPFRYDVRPGEKVHVKITGNNQGTKLFINGELRDDLHPSWIQHFVPNDKGHLAPTNPNFRLSQMRTLVFPLKQAGQFKSKVKNLKVKNFAE